MKDDKGAAMRRMVNALPEEHRTVIDLAYYHGRSVTEIGDILSIPVATVKTRMFYARKKLGEALKAAGYDRGWPMSDRKRTRTCPAATSSRRCCRSI